MSAKREQVTYKVTLAEVAGETPVVPVYALSAYVSPAQFQASELAFQWQLSLPKRGPRV